MQPLEWTDQALALRVEDSFDSHSQSTAAQFKAINKEVILLMHTGTYARLIKFLQDELSLSKDSIAIAQRSFEKNPGSFPMILWQYGLVTLEQLDRIFDWLDSSPNTSNS